MARQNPPRSKPDLRHLRRFALTMQLGLASIGLAACGDYAADYPTLAPTDELLAPPHIPAHAAGALRSPDAVNSELAADHAKINARANVARHQGPSSGDLAERARALRVRAASLSQTAIEGEAAPEDTATPAASGEDPASTTSVCPPDNRDCALPANQ